MAKSDFRRFVPEMGTAFHFEKNHKSFLEALPERWPRRQAAVAKQASIPYRGITTDGHPIPGLFTLRDEGAPTAKIIEAVAALDRLLTPQQRKVAFLPLESQEKHTWSNGISHFETHGVRLDQERPEIREAALGVLRASLSPVGYERARNAMRLNGFLGDLVGAPELLGEYTYQIHFFGQPSLTEPWGWQWSGHHICLTCFILGSQMTITPTFIGVEPCYIDRGPHAGLSMFDDEERHGLEFARRLSAEQKRKAVVYDTILAKGLPPGRHDSADGMNLGGAFQDNRIIAYEGIPGTDLDPNQRRDLLSLAELYLATLPEGPLAAKMSDVERHIAETYFCWCGGLGDESVFYYRIQSPVMMAEFDHHKGVVLNNKEPEKFHIHTIVRTPNGNDYGTDLLRQHYEQSPHHARQANPQQQAQAPSHDHDHGHDHGHDHHHHGHDHHHDHGHHDHGHHDHGHHDHGHDHDHSHDHGDHDRHHD